MVSYVYNTQIPWDEFTQRMERTVTRYDAIAAPVVCAEKEEIMKYSDYKEQQEHGTFNFPIAFYHKSPHSPNYEMPYHWHTYFEVIRIIFGTFHLTLDNETKEYRQGDIIFITSGMLHGGGGEDCVYESVVFDLQILMKPNHACTRALQDVMDQKIIVNTLLSERSAAVSTIVRDLCLALSCRRTGSEFMIQGYLYQLFGVIFEERLYEECPSESAASGRLYSIKKVLAYISENYASNISLDCLAKIAGMNPKYFCQYFRSMTDRTPINYLNYYRIECACEMLAKQNVSIKQVAVSCGFNDESYFIKMFQKYKGTTPKRFMKQAI